MKLGIVSDLHLEFRWPEGQVSQWERLQSKINHAGADLIINAGDTHPLPEVRKCFDKDVCVPYATIMGNHDFYQMQRLTPSRFVQYCGDLKVVGATLWTDFDNGNPVTILKFPEVLADAHQIVPSDRANVVADEMFAQFKSDLEFIKNEQPDIVVTHHAPSYKSVHPRFRSTGFINHFFMSNLDDFILDNPNIKLWIHGHMHDPCNYTIGGCRVLSNPLGYPGETYKKVSDYNVLMIGV